MKEFEDAWGCEVIVGDEERWMHIGNLDEIEKRREWWKWSYGYKSGLSKYFNWYCFGSWSNLKDEIAFEV